MTIFSHEFYFFFLWEREIKIYLRLRQIVGKKYNNILIDGL